MMAHVYIYFSSFCLFSNNLLNKATKFCTLLMSLSHFSVTLANSGLLCAPPSLIVFNGLVFARHVLLEILHWIPLYFYNSCLSNQWWTHLVLLHTKHFFWSLRLSYLVKFISKWKLRNCSGVLYCTSCTVAGSTFNNSMYLPSFNRFDLIADLHDRPQGWPWMPEMLQKDQKSPLQDPRSVVVL